MERGVSEYLEQAESLFREDRVGDAIAVLTTALEIAPDNLLLKVKLADYLRREGRMDEAIDLYRKCALQYVDQGARPHAIALYKLLVPLSPAPLLNEDGTRPLLRELVQRYLRQQESAPRTGDDAGAPPVEIPLFKDLSREELEEIIGGIVPIRKSAGEVVFREGDEGASLFVVTKGFVRVTSTSRSGTRLPLARLGPGDFFGEWSLLARESRRHASIEAETDIELLELTREALNEVIQTHPRVQEILETYSRRRQLDTLLARVFPALSPIERKKMAEWMNKEVQYPAGAIIYREGEPSDYMSIIQKGAVEVYTQNLDGDEIVLAELGPGQFFGEAGALSGNRRSASVRARTDVTLHHIWREDLVTALAHHPDMLDSLQGVRAERIGATLEKLAGSDHFELAPDADEAARGGGEESK